MEVTNAEKIRNMTDEELAMMLMCPAEYSLEFSKTSECNGEWIEIVWNAHFDGYGNRWIKLIGDKSRAVGGGVIWDI